jgi:hypothetical protein
VGQARIGLVRQLDFVQANNEDRLATLRAFNPFGLPDQMLGRHPHEDYQPYV